MKSEEEKRIDEIRVEFDLVTGFLSRVMKIDFMRELGATDDELDAMLHHRSQIDAIFASLKSALADTERIDALERDARVFSPPGSDNELNGVVVSWYPSKGQTLREAIDERRK